MKQSILKKSASNFNVSPTGIKNEPNRTVSASQVLPTGQSKAPVTESASQQAAPTSAKIVRFVGVDSSTEENPTTRRLTIVGNNPSLQLQQPTTSMLTANLKSFSLSSSKFYKNKYKNNLRFIMNENEKKSNSTTPIAPATTPIALNSRSRTENNSQGPAQFGNQGSAPIGSKNVRNYYKGSTAIPFKQISIYTADDETDNFDGKNDPKSSSNQKPPLNPNPSSMLQRQRSYLSVDSVTKIADGSIPRPLSSGYRRTSNTPSATKLKFNPINSNGAAHNNLSFVIGNGQGSYSQNKKEGPAHYYNFTSLGADNNSSSSIATVDNHAEENKYGRKIFSQIQRLVNDGRLATPANTNVATREDDQANVLKQPSSADYHTMSPGPMDSNSRVSSPIYYSTARTENQSNADDQDHIFNKENSTSSILKRPKTAKKNVKTALNQSTFANQSSSSTSTIVGNPNGLSGSRKPSNASSIYFPSPASATFLGKLNRGDAPKTSSSSFGSNPPSINGQNSSSLIIYKYLLQQTTKDSSERDIIKASLIRAHTKNFVSKFGGDDGRSASSSMSSRLFKPKIFVSALKANINGNRNSKISALSQSDNANPLGSPRAMSQEESKSKQSFLKNNHDVSTNYYYINNLVSNPTTTHRSFTSVSPSSSDVM